jgi:hypothetical protein
MKNAYDWLDVIPEGKTPLAERLRVRVNSIKIYPKLM